MGDFVMRTGDTITITIDPPTIVPQLQAPVALTGSGGSVTVNGMSVCLVGDEIPVQIKGPLEYTAPPFTQPGVGTLTLTLLPPNMTSQTMMGKPLLIKGGPFVAMFMVTEPAMQPTPAGPVPDPLLEKPGTAQFTTTNDTVRAS
jgi:hypothetical protein